MDIWIIFNIMLRLVENSFAEKYAHYKLCVFVVTFLAVEHYSQVPPLLAIFYVKICGHHCLFVQLKTSLDERSELTFVEYIIFLITLQTVFIAF